MTRGTSYFVNRYSAIKYLSAFGFDEKNVDHRLACKEIHIGKPPFKEGESLILNEDEGRYYIDDMIDLQDYKRNAFQLRKEVEEARSRQTLRKLRASIVEDQPK